MHHDELSSGIDDIRPFHVFKRAHTGEYGSGNEGGVRAFG